MDFELYNKLTKEFEKIKEKCENMSPEEFRLYILNATGNDLSKLGEDNE